MSLTSVVGNLVLARGQGFLKNLFPSSSSTLTAAPYRAGKRAVRLSYPFAQGPNRRGATTILSYPLNVEDDPQQGHYIMFFAKVLTKKPEVAPQARRNEAARVVQQFEKDVTGRGLTALAAARAGGRATIEATILKTGNIAGPSMTILNKDMSGSDAIYLKSNPNVETLTAISLYMPPSVQVSYESKYGDQDIGLMAGTTYRGIKAFMRGGPAAAWNEVVEGAEDLIRQGMLASLDTVAPGAKALFAIEKGKIITPKMELMFEGIGRRSFSFTFSFIPKSQPEAIKVEEIVKMFKIHMAADYVEGGKYREMSFPDLFDIEYMHNAEQNQHLNRIATCALTKMDVEYGGERYVAYDDGRSQTTKLTLNFTEMEIITKTKIKDGY